MTGKAKQICTIPELIGILEHDRETPVRFPVRLIFIDDLDDYYNIIGILPKFSDEIIRLSDYMKSIDTYPDMNELIASIRRDASRSFSILSMAEYLRINSKKELGSSQSSFMDLVNIQQPMGSKRKIYIPLLMSEDILDKIWDNFDQRFLFQKSILHCRTDSIYKETSDIKLSIHNKAFNPQMEKSTYNGIREWINAWDDCQVKRDSILITNRTENIEAINGRYSISIILDAFTFARENLIDGELLRKDLGNEDQWLYFCSYINYDKTLDGVLRACFNTLTIDNQTLSKWKAMSNEQRWLLWLFYSINSQQGYLGYVMSNTSTFQDLENNIMNCIFGIPRTEETKLTEEYLKLLSIMELLKRNEEFWERIETIKDYSKRLDLLTAETHEEREYLLKTISLMMRAGYELPSSILLKFPALHDYLSNGEGLKNETLNQYLQDYKEWKLKNQFNREFIERSASLADDVSSLETRYCLVNEYSHLSDSLQIVCIDAMGAEWTDYFVRCIKRIDNGVKIDVKVGTAVVPTETKFNKIWDGNEVKYNKLDNIMHYGEPDDKGYYSCIARQFEIINEFARKAIRMLKNCDLVIATADHGTSRQAALGFHELAGFKPPKGAVVKSLGRYCELSDNLQQNEKHPYIRQVETDGKLFAVMLTQEHFQQSGNATGKNDEENATAGEIHGGLTPEECLVPVIALSREPIRKASKPHFSLVSSNVYIDTDKKARLRIATDRPINSLIATTFEAKPVEAVSQDMINWTLVFEDLKPGKYQLRIYIDELYQNEPITMNVLRRGIQVEDDL